jgi:hypothetical protein
MKMNPFLRISIFMMFCSSAILLLAQIPSLATLHDFACGSKPIVIVVVEMAGGLIAVSGFEIKAGSVHKQNVGPAVAVVIENSDAASRRFQKYFLDSGMPFTFRIVRPARKATSSNHTGPARPSCGG